MLHFNNHVGERSLLSLNDHQWGAIFEIQCIPKWRGKLLQVFFDGVILVAIMFIQKSFKIGSVFARLLTAKVARQKKDNGNADHDK